MVVVVTVTVTVTVVMICPLLLTPVCKRPGEVGGKDGRPAPEAMRPVRPYRLHPLPVRRRTLFSSGQVGESRR